VTREEEKVTGATIDHLISVTVFLAAILLFISLFNQTLQTAILYQRHRALATKASGLLDTMLLSSGYPLDWGKTNATPTGFGLQDPEFTQYKLSPFSLMRLRSFSGTPVYYEKTGLYYSNLSMGFGNFLLVPYNQVINYSTASTLLGTNNTDGFQLTITPIIAVSVTETHAAYPLTLSVSVTGKGFPLANADISYAFIRVVEKGGGQYPSYISSSGSAFTDETGEAVLNFADVAATDSYALIAYAHLSGLVGVGYRERVTSDKKYVIPFIDDFEERRVLLAHSYDIHYFGPPESAVFYNATFLLLSEDFTLREMPLEGEQVGKVGKAVYGEGQPYGEVTIPTYNPGILVITYESNNEYGVVLMPWGLSAMAFPITFGGSPSGQEWVANDKRHVIVNNVAYQAELALWSLEGYQVIG